MEAQGTKLLLLGIDVTIFGVILALTTSGSSGAIAIIVGLSDSASALAEY